jgi:Ketosteroid isomerase homolog
MTDADAPTPALLEAMDEAFNRNDIDAVMAFFAEDAVFDHAAGPEVHGTRFEGKAAIRAAFGGLFERTERVHWETLDARIAGEKAYCEYLRTATAKSGETDVCRSIDVLTFRAGLIVRKDTFFKQRVS